MATDGESEFALFSSTKFFFCSSCSSVLEKRSVYTILNVAQMIEININIMTEYKHDH